MPDVDTHCKISRQRSGGSNNDFKELHEWIDEPQKFFGMEHRIERHTLNSIYLDYVEKMWGKKGVIEWLFHIAIDNLETANKFAFKEYGFNNFEKIEVIFKDRDLDCCSFKRDEERRKKKKEEMIEEIRNKEKMKGGIK